MLFTDQYNTIEGPAEAEYKDRGSKFIGYASPLTNEDQAKEWLKGLKKEHHAAAHHCWAYVLMPDGSFQKSSDDREPSGTAGKPILRTILSAQLTYLQVVVVRYFGGKLLGVPGLIQAYGEAARLALGSASKKEVLLWHRWFVQCVFEKQHELIVMLKQQGLKSYPGVHLEQEGLIFEVQPTRELPVVERIKQAGFATPKLIE